MTNSIFQMPDISRAASWTPDSNVPWPIATPSCRKNIQPSARTPTANAAATTPPFLAAGLLRRASATATNIDAPTAIIRKVGHTMGCSMTVSLGKHVGQAVSEEICFWLRGLAICTAIEIVAAIIAPSGCGNGQN